MDRAAVVAQFFKKDSIRKGEIIGGNLRRKTFRASSSGSQEAMLPILFVDDRRDVVIVANCGQWSRFLQIFVFLQE